MTPTTRPWHYADDDQPQGPVPQAELEEMLLSGRLHRGTLVWSHPMEDWAPAAEVEALSQAIDPPPPPLPEDRKEPPPLEAEVEAAQRSYERSEQGRPKAETPAPEGAAGTPDAPAVAIGEIPAARQESTSEQTWDSAPRPWRRYFAKLIDLNLFAVVVGFLYGFWTVIYDPAFATMEVIETGNAWLMVPIVALWIPVEAWAVATWHTTPGKWLTGLRVVRPSGHPWSYQDALHRTGSMVWRGFALGIPIASLVTMIVAYNKLSKNGVTTWDADHDFNVAYIGMGPGRWALLVPVLILLVWAWVG